MIRDDRHQEKLKAKLAIEFRTQQEIDQKKREEEEKEAERKAKKAELKRLKKIKE